MFVRIARFEDVDPSGAEEMAAAMKEQMDAMRGGDTPEGIPADAAAALREDVVRVLDLVDRGSRTGAGVVFTDTEEGMHRVDAALNQLSPGEGGGRRASVEIYEVLLDETFG